MSVLNSANWGVYWSRRSTTIVVEADDGCAGGAWLDKIEATALRDALTQAIEEVWGPDDS